VKKILIFHQNLGLRNFYKDYRKVHFSSGRINLVRIFVSRKE